MANSWLTSNALIEAIKRKIMMPISQVTFDENDILSFANEEMMISQVPSVLDFHEEYYVTTETIPLESNKDHYPIPDRAIGMKLRDIFWSDSNGNLHEMTRVASEDRAVFQQTSGTNQAVHKFYLEGNDVVLLPKPTSDPTGSLVFVYFIRPNQLVTDDRAAIIDSFCSELVVDNSFLIAGDTVSIGGVTFTAVSGAPSTNEFQIGGTSVTTATNLVTAINTNGIVTASNGTVPITTVTAFFTNLNFDFSTSNSSAFIIEDGTCLSFTSIPDNISEGTMVDFLQTKSGHKIKNYDIEISSGSINGTKITFPDTDIPDDLVVGDYICSAHECIIPFLPDDLHSALAERTCSRILSAMGDQEGLISTNAKIQEIESRQISLLDNRVESSPLKVTARHSPLRYGQMGPRRRFS